jgi:pilus assembly protein CpaB
VTLQVTPEQAEKLALASSEGKLQLVMRNSVDQADEQTSGANKRTLLNGERATLVPDAGIGSNSAPKAAPTSSRRFAPRPVPKETAAPKASTQPPPAPRPTIEVIKGAKKEIQDFPS